MIDNPLVFDDVAEIPCDDILSILKSIIYIYNCDMIGSRYLCIVIKYHN